MKTPSVGYFVNYIVFTIASLIIGLMIIGSSGHFFSKMGGVTGAIKYFVKFGYGFT